MVKMTRDEAVAKLVEWDVACHVARGCDDVARVQRYRAMCEAERSKLTHGLALHALAHYERRVDKKLAAQAAKVMTPADRTALRHARAEYRNPFAEDR